MPLRSALPYPLFKVLFGDRAKWGSAPDTSDPMWQEWVAREPEIYRNLYQSGRISTLNNAGYAILSSVDLAGKSVLEIGPGDLPHMGHWIGKPSSYTVVDQAAEFLRSSEAKLSSANIDCRSVLTERAKFSLDIEPVDVILTFYSLEHLNPLSKYLAELHRLLRPGGILAGAIPAEGGLAWGLGRALTSRRWFKKNSGIDLDKIICWEHPNYADTILRELDDLFVRKSIKHWPMGVPLIDTNLVVSFVYEKRQAAVHP